MMATADQIPAHTTLEESLQKMGVENIWIIDATTGTARICLGASRIEASRLEVTNTESAVELTELFPLISSLNV